MGRKLDALMGKAFRSSKCKTLLKLTIARLKILRNKRELQVKQLRKDVAQLLQNGQEASARLRVEHIFREQNILDAYLLIGGYSETVAERMMSIKMQKMCPNDLKESIASLVFAAPRCADLPELQDVRSLFAAKYGKEFTESAVELRPDCGVNMRIIEKLSTRIPSPEAKLKLMKEIAFEHSVEWNFKETEPQKLKPAEDFQDGSKKNSEIKQTTSKPEDVTNEPVKTSTISSKEPDTVRQQSSVTTISRPSSATSPLDVSTKGEQEILSSTKQGYGETTNADINNPNSLHDPLHVNEESDVSPNSASNVDPNMLEYDLYTRKRMEGKMHYDLSMENAAAYQNLSSSDTDRDFVKFAKKDGVSADLKRESVKYTDAASAAQAAFESAAYAAAAARAAVELSKCELRNKSFDHRMNDSREAMPESEDELARAILREQQEEKYAVPHGVGSGIEDSSTKYNQETDINSPRTRIGGNDVFSAGLGFEKTHNGEKEVSDSESVEEPSEDEAAWSKDKRSHGNRSSQEHLSDYSDDHEEYGTNSLSEDRKLNNQKMDIGTIEPQFKRFVSGSTSNSSEQSSSNKVTQPVFDDYDDDESDFENTTSEKPSYLSMPTPHRRPGTEDTQLGYAHYTSNHRQIHDYDENDGYEKNTVRKEYKIHDFTPKTLVPTKLSYGDFVQKEKYSLQSFELESEDEMETLNDESGVKSPSHRKMAMQLSQPDASYQSPHGVSLKQSIEGTMSANQSTYPEYGGNYRKYELPHGIKKQYSDPQASDDEGVYRYEGDGKLHWRPANLAKQPASVESHKSNHVNSRMSVRTRR